MSSSAGETILKGIGAIVIVAFGFPVLGALMGMFSGWLLGLFWGDDLLRFFEQLGINGFTTAKLGLLLGFCGGFFSVASPGE